MRSPLLSNICLNPLDHLRAGRGYEMVRTSARPVEPYADAHWRLGGVILCRSKQDTDCVAAQMSRPPYSPSMAVLPSRFEDALRRIDAANAHDPDRITDVDGYDTTAAVVYSRRMSAWVATLYPQASEALQLAARAQHVRRWEIRRDQFPMDRAGYHRWRSTLYRFHADTAAALLKASGYDDATVDRVGSLLRKERLKTDPLMQALEDVICLVVGQP